jgi:hypothetical protein
VNSLGTGTIGEIITGFCAWCESQKPEAEHLVEMKAQMGARPEPAR